jgi:hypothetical protein
MSGKEFLAKSKNNKDVFYDGESSHAATHFADTPNLKELVAEVLSGMDLANKEVATHVDLGRTIGTCDVVDVHEGDKLIYGIRRNRESDGLVPFVQNREGDPCSTIALHVVPQEDGTYELSSAWIGTFGGDDEPFPNAPAATERSVDFWNKHAFVHGSQEIMAGTETSQKPW